MFMIAGSKGMGGGGAVTKTGTPVKRMWKYSSLIVIPRV